MAFAGVQGRMDCPISGESLGGNGSSFTLIQHRNEFDSRRPELPFSSPAYSNHMAVSRDIA
jgi:hypothetical protein